jgi:hypothetical protein
VWVKDWRALINVIGWFSIFVGAFRIMFSQVVSKNFASMIAKQATMPTVATVLGVLGCIFAYYGYFN